jgi:hypothetical protein
MSDQQSKGLPSPTGDDQKTNGFGARLELENDTRRFTSRLKHKYSAEIDCDAKGFKKCVVHLVRRGLPPLAGRPNEAAITLADELRKRGLEWKAIYTQCIPNHANLPPAERRIAENNLRAARRSRKSAARRRRKSARTGSADAIKLNGK